LQVWRNRGDKILDKKKDQVERMKSFGKEELWRV